MILRHSNRRAGDNDPRYSERGRDHQEADHEIRLAEELDPLSPTLQTQAFYIHMVGRRWDKAHAAARKHAELVPGGLTHVDYTSVLLALEGKCGAALDELAKFNLMRSRG